MKNSFKKHFIVGLYSLAFSLAYSLAHAYDVDTHFYGTYSMARFAGIKHEIAAKIATGAQWMDESYISDPVSTILAADFGVKKRRLLHFPGSRLGGGSMELDVLSGVLALGANNKLSKFTETKADDDFATEMFTEGLMEGNLMKASAGLHTLEDSFAHAGTFAELGHTEFWHHPDRPYINKESIEKYFRMSRSVLRAMVAIRRLLPSTTIDENIKFSGIPNAKLNGDQLADLYENSGDRFPQLRLIKETVSYNVLTDPEFVRGAVSFCFDRAFTAKYVVSRGYLGFINSIIGGETAVQAITRIAKELLSDKNQTHFDVDFILKETGRAPRDFKITSDFVDVSKGDRSKDFSDYVQSKGEKDALLRSVVVDLIAGTVPRELDVYHRVEKEEDGYVWKLELKIRERRMKDLIRNLYGNEVTFVPNNTSDFEGFRLELLGRSPINPNMQESNDRAEYATYTPAEKTEFDLMIFKYIFPTLSEKIGRGYKDIVNLIAPSPKDSRLQIAINIHKGAFAVAKTVVNGVNIFETAHHDIVTARMVANPLNTYYRDPDLTLKLMRLGIFQSFKVTSKK